jgi:hypothetical protein
MKNEITDQGVGKSGGQPASQFPIRSDSLKFLYDVVSASYKEQNDLDESVWRSMPFIAALFGLAVTVIRFVPPHLSFSGDNFQFALSAIYVASMAAFILAFLYFWEVAMPRYFETPAKSVQMRDHAIALTAWYVSEKPNDKGIDAKVTDDMRRLMIDQLSNAIDANRPVVEKRLAARSRTILLLLAGFAFISVSEMITFSMKEFGSRGDRIHADGKSTADESAKGSSGTSSPAQSNAGAARR